MSLLFYPSESESALQIITQALELDSKAGIELTAKNLVVRLSDRSAAEKWKAERDVAGLTTKWFSNRYHQNQTRDKNGDSGEQVSRMQHQVDFLTQELNTLKETVASLVETKESSPVEVKKPRSTQKPKVSQKNKEESTEHNDAETTEEVKPRVQKKATKSPETTEVKPVEVKTRGRKKTT